MLRRSETSTNVAASNGITEERTIDQKLGIATFRVIFISLLLDLIGFTIILPLFPSILNYYRVHDKNGLYPYFMDKISLVQQFLGTPQEFNTVLFGGLIGSLFSFLQFTSSPVIGALSDIYGRRNVLIITMVGISVSYFIWGISRTFTIFVLARIIGGICKGNVSLSTAIVTDISNEQTRGRGMAMVGIAFSVGFIIGPMIGAFFANKYDDYGTVPSSIALILSIINIAFLILSFKETLPEHKRTVSLSAGMNKALSYINPKSLFAFQPLVHIKDEELVKLKRIGMVYFIYLFLYSGLEFTLTFLTHMRFNYKSMDQGKMFLFMGSVMIIAQGGFVRRIPPGKEIQTAIMGLVLIIPSFILIGVSFNSTTLYLGLFLYALSTSCVVPCLTTVVSSCGSVGEKGTVMGIFRSIGALARAVGPVVASIGYWSFGPTLSYSIGGILLLIPMNMLRSVK